MSAMAKCLRLAFSASNKLVYSYGTSHLAHNSFPRLNPCQKALKRQINTVVIWPHLRFTPSLAAVKTSTCYSYAGQHLHCRRIQTEVDKELCKFLAKEINYEESTAGKTNTQIKGVDGFEVITNDADITLTRKSGSETVVVKFSINGSVDSDDPLPGDEQEAEAEMISRPPFTVELCKGDGRTLSFHCLFVPPEEADHHSGPQDAESIVDSFEIQEVALHTGEWKETVYSVSADVMDGNLYDLLMDMLDERGINEEFANQLVDFSTSYEHSRYLTFLKGLKTFSEK